MDQVGEKIGTACEHAVRLERHVASAVSPSRQLSLVQSTAAVMVMCEIKLECIEECGAASPFRGEEQAVRDKLAAVTPDPPEPWTWRGFLRGLFG